MGERDAAANHEQDHRWLGSALADLADTMPEDPYRVESIHAAARRLRNRRRVSRVTAGVVVSASTIAALVAVRPGMTDVSTIPASQPTTTPSCLDALATMPTPTPVPEGRDAIVNESVKPGGVGATDALKLAASDADRTNAAFGGLKGTGIVVGATDTSVTIRPDAPMPDGPTEITATIASTAVFADGEDKVDMRPALNAGDRVAFAATEADDGAYQLIYLGVRLPVPPTPNDDTVDATRKAANATADSRVHKGVAEVVSVQPDSLTLKVIDGDLGDEVLTATTGPDSVYTAGDQKCLDPQLSEGQVVGVLLVQADDGSYFVERVALFEHPATATPAG